MPLTPDQLPDDIIELKRRLIAKDAELLARSSELAIKVGELAAAKNGLIVTQLTIEKLKENLGTEAVRRPPHWSGFLVVPREIEFWQDGEFRLHDRVEFRRSSPEGEWDKVRMYP